MNTFDKILSPEWKPYGKSLKKIFKDLKEEGFLPHKKLNHYNENNVLVKRTYIEHLFLSKKGILLTGRTFNSKSAFAYDKQWFKFFKELGEFFNIDYNDVKVSRAFDKEIDVYKTNNLFSLFSFPEISHKACQSIVDLGVDPTLYINSYFYILSDKPVKMESCSPILWSINAEHVKKTEVAIFMGDWLLQRPELLHSEYLTYDVWTEENEVNKIENIFTLISQQTVDDRNILSNAIYKVFQDALDTPISTKNLPNPGVTLKTFFQQNSPYVWSMIEKKALEETISAIEEKASIPKKRL